MGRKLWIGLAVATFFLGAVPGWAATINVPGDYLTIQGAIDAAVAGDTILIADGTYIASNTTVNKTLILQGESKAGVVIAPAANDGQANVTYDGTSQQGFIVVANDVTIKDLTIDGDANNLANGGTLTNQHNFRTGILNTGSTLPGPYNNLTVQNVVIRNIVRRGINLFPATSSGHLIKDNFIENITYMQGIYSAAAPVTITGNTIRGAGMGIGLYPALAESSGLTLTVTDNTLYDIAGSYSLYYGHDYPAIGIYYRNPNYDESVIITGNHLTMGNGAEEVDMPGVTGMYIYNADAHSRIADNTIDSTAGTNNWGIYFGGCAGTVIDNNIFTMNELDSGICVGRGDPGIPVPNIISNNTFTSTGSTSAAIGEGSAILQSNDGGVFWMAEIPYNTDSIIAGNTISGFVRGIALHEATSGTYVQLGTTVKASINLNNISGNSLFGVDASTLATPVDAINNWWGDNSGPTHASNPSGTGDAVSDNVDFDSWLRVAVEGTETEEIPASTTETIENGELGIGADVTTNSGGSSTVILAEYSGNPSGVAFDGSYYDLFVSDPGNVGQVILKLYYNEPANKQVYWFDGSAWALCSNQAVVAEPVIIEGISYDGRVEVTINDTTTPSLSDLSGTIFALATPESPTGDSGSLPVGPLAAGISALLVWWKRRKQN